jgi:hypothetical protein
VSGISSSGSMPELTRKMLEVAYMVAERAAEIIKAEDK